MKICVPFIVSTSNDSDGNGENTGLGVACKVKGKLLRYRQSTIPSEKPKTKNMKWKTWASCEWSLKGIKVDRVRRYCSLAIATDIAGN